MVITIHRHTDDMFGTRTWNVPHGSLPVIF